jgi:hypothetical protein
MASGCAEGWGGEGGRVDQGVRETGGAGELQ